MNLQDAARTALEVQDACNLSGVLRAFNRVVTEVLWPEANQRGHGTEWVNSHPLCTLFLAKLTDLNRSACYCTASSDAFGTAYDAVRAIALDIALNDCPCACHTHEGTDYACVTCKPNHEVRHSESHYPGNPCKPGCTGFGGAR